MSSRLPYRWSFKLWWGYTKCPFWAKLKYVERIPEPPRDEKSDAPRLRGIKMHDEMEACINQTGPIPVYARPFEHIVTDLVEAGAVAEQDMFLNDRWEPHPTWEGSWLQVKQDVLLIADDYVLTGDWKSGRKFGNEFAHYKQMQLYSIAAWRYHPGLAEYVAELYYLDKDDIWSVEFREHQLEKAMADFDREVDKMLNDTIFRPKPNTDSCRFCPYNKKNSGACPVAAV